MYEDCTRVRNHKAKQTFNAYNIQVLLLGGLWATSGTDHSFEDPYQRSGEEPRRLRRRDTLPI